MRGRTEARSEAHLAVASRRRLWLARGVIAVFVPLIILAGLEGTLRWIDFGYPTQFFLKDESESGTWLVANERFAWQFYSTESRLRPHPFAIPLAKAPETIRIIVLGESAAYGTPEAAYGFVRILERMLQIRFPERNFEVVNAAMPGINSHIILPIAREIARLHPDLCLIYMGNNEVVGLHAPDPESIIGTMPLGYLRFAQAVRSSKIGQLFAEWLPGGEERRPDDGQGMDFFRSHRIAADDRGRTDVISNFEANLNEILRETVGLGAKVLLSTVAVNLRDCPPLGSLHRSGLSSESLREWNRIYEAGASAERDGKYGEALVHYASASEMDDQFAELHFRIARCYELTGRPRNAEGHYALARDLDALPFRADKRINTVIRDAAREWQSDGAEIVDAERRFREEAIESGRVLGGETFYEHVHFRFQGDYKMAKLLFHPVVVALRNRLGAVDDDTLIPPDLEACAEALAFTPLKEAEMISTMINLTADPPFLDRLDQTERIDRARQELGEEFADLGKADLEAAIATFQNAMKEYPRDWNLPYQLGRLQLKLRDFSGSSASMSEAKRLMPFSSDVTLGLCRALMESGANERALREITELLKERPDLEQARIAWRKLREGRIGP